MSWAHLRRIATSLVFIFAVAVLALIIDGVAYPLYEFGLEEGVADGPFGAVYDVAGMVMWWPVPILLVGILIWILIGPIQRTRREERRRRIR